MAYQEIGLRVILLGVGEFRRSVGIIRSDLTGLEKDLRGLNSTTAAISQKMSQLGNTFVTTGRALTLGLTLPIAGLLGSLVGAGIQFEDSFAGVAKTVEGVSLGVEDTIRWTPELTMKVYELRDSLNAMGSAGQEISFDEAMQIFIANLSDADKEMIFSSELFGKLTARGDEVRDAFRQMSLEIPISADELARIGTIAGELGVPTESLVEFTRVAALMGVATNLSSDQAAEAFGRFGNIFQVSKEDIADWSRSFGSSLVALGNTTAGTESEISNMSLRVAAAGRIAGLTEQEILAVSATMIELGIKSERGGTAFSRILQEMMFAIADGGPQLQEFARISGLTTDELAELFQTDPTKAVQAFTQGFSEMSAANQIGQEELDNLNLTGVRVVEVMRLLGLATDNYSANLETANTAWDQQIALEEEAHKRFETVRSQIQLTKNAFKDLGIQIFDLYREDIENLVTGIGNLITKFKDLDPKTQKIIVTIAGIAAVIGPLLVIIGTLMLTLAPVVSVIGAIGGAIASFGGLILTVGRMILMAGTFFSPIGIAILLIGTALAAYHTNFMGFRDFVDELVDLLASGDLGGALNLVGDALGNVADAILDLLSKIPGADWLYDTLIKPLVDAVDWDVVLRDVKSFGDSFLDILKINVDIAKFVYDNLLKPIDNALRTGDFSSLLDGAKSVGSKVWNAISGGVGDAADWVNDHIIVPITDKIKEITTEDVTNAAAGAGAFLAKIYVAIANFEVDVIAWALEHIVTPIALAIANTDWIGNFTTAGTVLMTALWGAIKLAWSMLVTLGTFVVDEIIAPFAEKITGTDFSTLMEAAGAAIVEGVKTAIITAVTLWVGVADWILEHVINPFLAMLVGQESADQITTEAQKITDAIKSGVQKFFEDPAAVLTWLKDTVITKITNAVPGLVQTVIDKFKTLGQSILDGFKQGILDGWGTFISWVETWLIDGIKESIRTGFGLWSPSRVTAQYGKDIMAGFQEGFQEGLPAVLQDMTMHIDAIIASVQGAGLANNVSNINTTSVTNTQTRNTRVFNPVYQTAPTREVVDATRLLYREWDYQG